MLITIGKVTICFVFTLAMLLFNTAACHAIRYSVEINAQLQFAINPQEGFDYSSLIGREYNFKYDYENIHGVVHYYEDYERTQVIGTSQHSSPAPPNSFMGDAIFTGPTVFDFSLDLSAFPLSPQHYHYYDEYLILPDGRHWLFSGSDYVRWFFQLDDNKVTDYYFWLQWLDSDELIGVAYHGFSLKIDKVSTQVIGVHPSAVPEPGTFGLLIVGMAILLTAKKIKKCQNNKLICN